MNRKKKKFICKLFLICILFMLPSISVAADNLENKELVHKNKVWKFTFNEKIESKDIKKNTVFVKNSEEKIVEVRFALQDNKRTLLIKPPKEGYKTGEQYTLFLSTGIGSNDEITNYLTIEFIIEEEEVKKENILDNTEEKEITFDKKIFNVKDYDGLYGKFEYDISLDNVISGEAAWEIIQQSNRFNTRPVKDKEYILAKFNINLKKTESDGYVKFDNKMFKIINENNEIYDPYECSIVLDDELDNKIVQGEECSGWIAGYIDKEDSPSIVINNGKDSEVSFKIKHNVQNLKKEINEEKEENKDKEHEVDNVDKKEVLSKEELLKYLEEYKDILFKDIVDNKEFEKFILNNNLESDKITQKEDALFDLKNNDILNKDYINSDDNLMMMYLYQMLNEKKNK